MISTSHYPSKVARICWNTNRWIKPSGKDGKGTYGGYEAEHGYGHEEWLFNTDFEIDGYVYGFIEPIRKVWGNYIGKTLTIDFATREKKSGEAYYVGRLNEVEVISKEEERRIIKLYKDNGWYDQLINDLTTLGLNANALSTWGNKEGLFNIRYRKEQIYNLSDRLIPINDKKIKAQLNRYVLIDREKVALDEAIENSTYSFFDSQPAGSKSISDLKFITRHFEEKELELPLRHQQIQKAFLKFLKAKHQKSIVEAEVRLPSGKYADLVQRNNDSYIIYEVKSYNSLLTSLRVAVGQLLEYSLFPGNSVATKLVLVSDILPSSVFRSYLVQLNQHLMVQINYICFDPQEMKIVAEA